MVHMARLELGLDRALSRRPASEIFLLRTFFMG